MDKFTPGPWFYRKSKNGSEFAVYWSEQCAKESIITYGGCGCCNESDESVASEDDARLIAAAPDLLEALEGLLAATDSELYGIAVSRARKAIARARGEV